MSLPVNFEEKVKLPAAVGGAGYPYRISAKDLMQNFVFASVIVDASTKEGFRNGIKEVISSGQGGHSQRKIYTEAFPENPSPGDLMYYDGSEWVSLAAPSGEGMHVLSHNGTLPSWVATEDCA